MTWQAVSMVKAAVVFDDAAPDDGCETIRIEGEPRKRRALADRIAAMLNATDEPMPNHCATCHNALSTVDLRRWFDDVGRGPATCSACAKPASHKREPRDPDQRTGVRTPVGPVDGHHYANPGSVRYWRRLT